MATHSNILAWEISWTEKPGGLQSMGSQKESDMTKPQTIFFFLTSSSVGNLRILCTRCKKMLNIVSVSLSFHKI